jgi:membrane fusion protein, multidrug efflux system
MKFIDLSFSKWKSVIQLRLTVLSFLLLSSFFPSCKEGNLKKQSSTDLQNIPVLEMKPMSIEVPITFVADIQAVQFVEIRAKVEGYVDQIFVDEGQFVKKGQILFQLSSMEFQEMVNSAQANLAQAKAEAQAAQVEVDRLRILVEKDIISPSELQLARSKKAVAESGIQEAEAILKNAQIGLSYTTIKAPFDGIVDRIPNKKGALIPEGELLTNITDISEVFAYFKITEKEYLSYMRAKNEGGAEDFGEDIKLILADGVTYQYPGKLETMEADFERGTGSIALRVRFSNPDQLIKHGSTGRIQINNQLDNVFLVPQKSTFEIQDYSYVYYLDKDNTVKVRSFKPVRRFGLFYVAEGFETGDKIIYEGIQQVKDGMVISPAQVSQKEAYDTLKFSLL